MKDLYTGEKHIEFTYKNRRKESFLVEQYKLTYGDMPTDVTKTFPSVIENDEVLACIVRMQGYSHRKKIYKTLFTKKIYIIIRGKWDDFSYRLYVDDVVEAKITMDYTKSSLNSLQSLSEGLSFKDYSQLVFDREQELKSMLLNENDEN